MLGAGAYVVSMGVDVVAGIVEATADILKAGGAGVVPKVGWVAKSGAWDDGTT